jgi:hypothetical protein
MIFLKQSRAACDSDHFNAVFARELTALPELEDRLQQALQFGSCAILDNIQIMLNRVQQDAQSIHVGAGIFYHSIIAGCNCADDPTPVDLHNEYCELHIDIDKTSSAALLKILP